MSVVGGWEDVRRSVRDEVGPSAYEAWFRNLRARDQGDRLVVLCPDRFSREWIERRYGAAVSRAASAFKSVLYEVQGGDAPGGPKAHSSPNRVESTNSGSLPAQSGVAPARRVVSTSPGRTEGLFDSFVSGPANALALEAARSVARGAAGQLSPLFLAGRSGAGKSHLCRSIARAQAQGAIYRTSEEFTSEVTTAMRRGTMDAVRQRYRRAHDLLILEDVQFLQGKRATQLELFHTIEHLIERGKAVVLTGDRPPQELDLEAKLRSRMGSGLIACLGGADLPMRREILRTRAAGGGLRLPEECLELLARRSVQSVGDLVSGLNQVVARATLLRRPIDLVLVRATLADVDGLGGRHTLDDILRITAQAYSLDVDALRGRSRRRSVVRPRHFAIYLCRRYTDHSLKEIGRAFRRDHTSVMHAIRSVEQRTAAEPQLRYEFEALASRFAAPSARP